MRYTGATAVAARLVPRTGEQWRPGVLGCDSAADLSLPEFRHGALNVFSTFPFTQFPAVEVLANAADSSQLFECDLVKIGG